MASGLGVVLGVVLLQVSTGTTSDYGRCFFVTGSSNGVATTYIPPSGEVIRKATAGESIKAEFRLMRHLQAPRFVSLP